MRPCQQYRWGLASIVLLLSLGLDPLVKAGAAPSGELRTAAAVRALTEEQARQNPQTHLRGVVTFFDSSLFSRFIQDETAGIYLFDSGLPIHLVPGDLVEVLGVSSPGEYAPIVVPQKITVVGRAPLPTPRRVTYQELASGQEDSQFVEIAGIVRSVQFHDPSKHFQIEIATGGGRLSVYARALPVKRPEELLDSKVRVRGVCSTKFNHQRQLFAIRLMVPRPEDLAIEVPAPRDPFEIKARPIGSLLRFAPQDSAGHRVRVEGTVIYFRPGETLFLQSGEQGVEVLTKLTDPLQLGDRVEALGFVGQGGYTPILQDAIFRKLASGSPLEPSPVTHDAALTGTFDSRLVRLTARLLDQAVNGADRSLILEEGGFIFHAYLRQGNGPNVFAGLENGSRISVTGVCRIDPGEWQAGEDWRAKSFSILMRSRADIVVLQAPSWWTLKRVLWIAGGLVFAVLAAFSWVAVLHRQVAEQTRLLEAQIQERQRAERQRAIEQERTRVAQDLHDELGATLTEVSMLGSLARTESLPAEAKNRYLEQLTQVSRSLVSTLDEIVWAVNPKYDTVASLASYYSLFAQRFLNLGGIACRLQVAESFPDLPMDSRLRHGVFLAFREALNNAVRHSGATEVRVSLSVTDGQLNIAVADNGKGFAALNDSPGSDGLVNMQQRLTKLGGHCQIKSQAGTGTLVEFQLPLGEHSS